jgi:hypothetical protein
MEIRRAAASGVEPDPTVMYPGGGPLSRALEEDSPGVEGLTGCFPGFIGTDLAWAQCMSQSTIDPTWVGRGMCEPTERLEENVVTPREREAKTLGCQANVTAGTDILARNPLFLDTEQIAMHFQRKGMHLVARCLMGNCFLFAF